MNRFFMMFVYLFQKQRTCNICDKKETKEDVYELKFDGQKPWGERFFICTNCANSIEEEAQVGNTVYEELQTKEKE